MKGFERETSERNRTGPTHRAAGSRGIAFLLTALLFAAVSFFFDFYFDLNDDVLMKDILAGVYTGIPEGHNIQMLYPGSLLISLLYRLYRNADWYGIFLNVCQFGCLFLLFERGLSMARGRYEKAAIGFLSLLLFAACLLPHLVFVQYTVTVAFLSGTAAFLLLTGEGGRNDMLAAAMVWLAYLLRSEMLLLTLPFVGLAVLFRWRRQTRRAVSAAEEADGTVREDSLRRFRGCVRYVCVLLAGLAVCTALHRIGYGSAEWREFTRLFDNRTELYDFQEIPDYAENEAFYRTALGLTQSEQRLLVNYNFGLDEKIDADVIGAVAEYAAKLRAASDTASPAGRLKTAGRFYFYRLHHMGMQEGYTYPQTDMPWNLIAALLYLAALWTGLSEEGAAGRGKETERREICRNGTSVWKRLWTALWPLLLLFAGRTALWGYILVRGRDPIRITHSLYFMECCLLAGLLLRRYADGRKCRTKKTGCGEDGMRPGPRRSLCAACVICAALCAASLVCLPNTVSVVREEGERRAEANAPYLALYAWCRAHPDNFYYIDVYSSVGYSEKMFGEADHSLANYDIMGGWASKSPVYAKKLAAYGFSSMQDALLEDNVFFVQEAEARTDWLSAYYADQGIAVSVEAADEIGAENGGKGYFTIYRVAEAF